MIRARVLVEITVGGSYLHFVVILGENYSNFGDGTDFWFNEVTRTDCIWMRMYNTG